MSGEIGKAAFLGLDGTPYTLLLELMDRGVMPNLKAIVEGGRLMRMETSLPEVSSVAWTTFMTGANPAAHGIFGFMDLKPGSYSLYFPNYGQMRQRTLWDAVGEAGGYSVVLNVPSTYPARPLKGVMASGFVALDLRKAAYPERAYEYLSGIGYRIDVDTARARESVSHLVEDLRETFRKRKEALLHLLMEEPWDLFAGVVTETDRLQHYLWSAYEDEYHPQHEFFLEFYSEIDSFIGEFMRKLKGRHPAAPLVMMSDHGFTAVDREVYVNSWLRENGYLDFTKTPAGSWEDIGERTRAFALDPSRIYINLKGKYPRGTVERGAEYERLREEIISGLMAIEVGGKKVIKAAYRKEDLYEGPFMDRAPDLVLLSNYGFDLKGAVSKEVLHDRGFLTGMHTQDDAFFFAEGDFQAEDKMNIADAGPKLLGLMGLRLG